MGVGGPLFPVSERKLGIAVTLGIVLEAIEILRRAPRWLLVLCGFLVYVVVWILIEYRWWIVGGLAVLYALRRASRRIGGLHP